MPIDPHTLTTPDLHPATTSGPSFLAHDQIAMIDEALRCVGDYGEVRLVVQKGKLRFIEIAKSVDVRQWETRVATSH